MLKGTAVYKCLQFDYVDLYFCYQLPLYIYDILSIIYSSLIKHLSDGPVYALKLKFHITVPQMSLHLGPLLLTWFNLDRSMDK